MSEVKIKFPINGYSVELTIEEAKIIYNDLKKIFEKDNFSYTYTKPTPAPIQKTLPPYTTETVIWMNNYNDPDSWGKI